jgi:hypothetical protein
VTFLPEWTAINLAEARIPKAGYWDTDKLRGDLARETEAWLRRQPGRLRYSRMDSGSQRVRANLPARREKAS